MNHSLDNVQDAPLDDTVTDDAEVSPQKEVEVVSRHVPHYRPLNYNQHKHLYIRPRDSMRDVADQAIIPLYPAEYHWAASEFPFAFRQPNPEGGLSMVAVFSPVPGTNCMVTSHGKWLGHYAPAVIRQVPFNFTSYPSADGGPNRLVMSIDEHSPYLSTAAKAEAEPLFVAHEKLGSLATGVQQFMGRLFRASFKAEAAVKLLQEHSLLIPWAESQKTITDEDRARYTALAELLVVDEVALQQLPDEALAALREAGALKLAYAQIFAMQRLPLLPRYASMSRRMAMGDAAALRLLELREMRLDEEEKAAEESVLKEDEMDFHFF